MLPGVCESMATTVARAEALGLHVIGKPLGVEARTDMLLAMAEANEGPLPSRDAIEALAEGVNFAQRAGLDVERVVDVIGKGAAQSWQMDNRARTMAADEFDFGFAVEWMRKDLGIVLDEADRNGARVPVTALVDQFYKDVVARGGERWDTSSLLARMGRGQK